MGLNQIELLSIEDTKRKRISFTGVSRLSLIYIWRVCKQKRLHSVKNEPFSLWTSLGLNQGPPDYENDKMIAYDSPFY